MTPDFCTILEPGIGLWRSAVIDTDQLPLSVSYHEDISLGAVDAIFDARVTRVESTLDMAFLDLGAGRSGMLNIRRAKLLSKERTDDIRTLVQEGQMLRVQVVAEPSALEDKALPVTPRPRLTGRYVVAESGGARLNFSKDLAPKAVKALTPLLSAHAEQAALIVRARAGDVSPDAVAAEAAWLTGILSAPVADKPGLVHAFSPMEQALLGVTEVHGGLFVEGGEALAAVKAAAETRWPDLVGFPVLYSGDAPIFEEFGVEEAIEEALAERINLPSGGWISIHDTPALTVIDVNMGGALKGRGAQDAKVIVNLEAAMAIAYHLRFQDIGGLIVADFIDMSAKGAARELMDILNDAFTRDQVPVQHSGVSAFGLVEFNRKRSGINLRQRLLQKRNDIERSSAIALNLLRRARRLGLTAAPGKLAVTAPQRVLDWLEAHPALRDELVAKTRRELVLTPAAGRETDIALV